MKLFRIYDSKAELYARIFQEQTDATARRAFGAACKDPESPYHGHPEDYSLWRVGSEDDTLGTITPEIAPVMVCTAQEALRDVERLRAVVDDQAVG